MKKIIVFCNLLLISFFVNAQIAEKINSAMNVFNNDDQLKFAISSLYIVDAGTGKVIYDQNGNIGMAPASTEKIITAATAFEMLGKDFSYESKFGIVTTPEGKSLYIEPSGDPSLGSWRWNNTREIVFLKNLKTALYNKGITNLKSVIINTERWDAETIPDGWIWQDVGNYYGAGALPINWRENQYDLILKSGNNMGDSVNIVKTNPNLFDYEITSKATAAAKGTGDNSFLYLPVMGNKNGVLMGTIPAAQTGFVVSGAMSNPMNQFVKTLVNFLKDSIKIENEGYQIVQKSANNIEWIYSNQSPRLSALIYWFLQKSINLYGEALVKTLALQKNNLASTDDGLDILIEFWKSRGIDPEALHFYDGSGLSPQNRTTTVAQVTVLQYAKKQPWFKEYYDAFPLYNNTKMKSGTINRVKGFCGYQKSKDGREYIFYFLVNNYNGSQLGLTKKMFKVLDYLK
jgi:D-alanyl-D-alanine carboxypeptidase/D-alanyl-D-alanine-endopeptidase (penicillin-binding protein 4)